MSNTIGSFDAKTHLAGLLDRVERGESITISRRGRIVARLVPVSDRVGRTGTSLIDAFRSLRSEVSPSGANIRELIEAGRRY